MTILRVILSDLDMRGSLKTFFISIGEYHVVLLSFFYEVFNWKIRFPVFYLFIHAIACKCSAPFIQNKLRKIYIVARLLQNSLIKNKSIKSLYLSEKRLFNEIIQYLHSKSI